jgi:glutamine synthetase
MARQKPDPLQIELKRFLRKHPDTDVMELLIADLPGILRGKRIRRKEFAKTFSDGFCLPGGTVLIDSIGDVIDGIPWSADDGDPDINARIVPGSLAPVPWAQRPAAQALYRFYTRNGEPFFADPRRVLERAAEPWMPKLTGRLPVYRECQVSAGHNRDPRSITRTIFGTSKTS